MIEQLARCAKEIGSEPCFYTQQESGTIRLSYRQVRFAAAALARGLQQRGYVQGTYLAANMYNCAEFVILALAAAYAGFRLVVLNPRLSEEEMSVRMIEVESSTGQADIAVVTEQALCRAVIEALGMDLTELASQFAGELPFSLDASDVLAFAEEREAAFDPEESGIVMFTSGTSGTPKAAVLSWANLAGAARSAIEMLMEPGQGVWQLALPLCHVGGFEVMVRSVLNASPFILYRRYNPQRILNDVHSFRVTHISVVDKMLRDLLDADKDRIVGQYHCILLGGAALSERTVKQALRQRAKLFASYGMTETCSMIACAKVTRSFNGGLDMLPGCQANVMCPDAQGAGSLHVKGPGVFEGYINARSSFTMDDWFVTGDRARIDRDGRLHVMEREHDVIISGGENIYPAEVREELLRIPGVRDAYVFGTADEEWGYRPVAFVEADYSADAIEQDHRDHWLYAEETGIHGASCPQEYARSLHEYLDGRMSGLHHPKHILVMREFPRTVAGKVDTQALRLAYDRRIDVKSVSLYRVTQPFRTPVVTAKGTISTRESFFVEVRDWAGRVGIGECVSFSTDWYLPETIEEDYAIMRDTIAQIVMSERYLHPSEVSASLATYPSIAAYPQAKSAIECALWDLYGKISAKPLRELIGGMDVDAVPGGVVVGIMGVEETLEQVDRAVADGYTRVKIKISPESAFEKVKAVRERYPNLTLMVDANQSFNEGQLDELYRLDRLNLACIEEPLDPNYVPCSGRTSLIERLSVLQEILWTPICLDESIATASDMEEAMAYENLRCYALKISKFGGIQPALDFLAWAQQRNAIVWMGGMFDTGVSKRTYAAFETLPNVELPGDIGDYCDYFEGDCSYPAVTCPHGMLVLNPEGFEAGIGCILNKDYLDGILTSAVTIAK